jgi:hypothetical protein
MAVVGAGALGLVGCSGMGLGGKTTDYTVGICVEGPILVPCRDLGKVPVPEAGQGLVTLVAILAAPYLAQTTNAKNCLFTSYPEFVGGVIQVTATAACTVKGVPVQQVVKLTFTPPAAG